MSNDKRPIIIKKVKKVVGGGHHGGSWKVAYADFVTAMMAFFLMMWLLNMTSEEKRAKLAMYFKTFSIFEKSGGSIYEGGAGKPFEKDTQDAQVVEQMAMNIGSLNEKNKQQISESIKGVIEGQLQEFKDQILITLTKEGIRIDIIDKNGNPVFDSGSPDLNSNGKAIMKVLSSTLNELDNRVVLEGHTDAITYRGDVSANWDLSVKRANSARNELLNNNFDSNKISAVTGYAATKPLDADNPNDPINRRISMVVLYKDDGGKKDFTPLNVPPKLRE